MLHQVSQLVRPEGVLHYQVGPEEVLHQVSQPVRPEEVLHQGRHEVVLHQVIQHLLHELINLTLTPRYLCSVDVIVAVKLHVLLTSVACWDVTVTSAVFFFWMFL